MPLNSGVGEELLRVPWTATRSNQSILTEINPEYSLEGLMLKLKLQYFGHLMQRSDSLEKTLMLGKIEGRRKRGWQRMRWLDSITNSWANFRSWWWTGKPGMLQCMGSQRVRHGWSTEQVWSGCFRSCSVFLQRLSNSMKTPHLWVKSNLLRCGGSVHCSRWNGQLPVEIYAVPSWTHPRSWIVSLPNVRNSIPQREEHCSKRTWWDGGGWWKPAFTEQLLCTHIGKCLHQLIYPATTLGGREELKMSQMATPQPDQDHSLT